MNHITLSKEINVININNNINNENNIELNDTDDESTITEDSDIDNL